MVPSGRDVLWWMDRKRGGERETRVKLVVEVRLPWEIIAGCEYADLVNSLPCNPWMNGRDKTVNDRNCVTVPPFRASRDDIWKRKTRNIPLSSIIHKLETLVFLLFWDFKRLISYTRQKYRRDIFFFFACKILYGLRRKSCLRISHLRYLFIYPFVSRNIGDWSSLLETEHYARHRNLSNLPSFMTVSRPQTRQVPGSARICASGGNSRIENACFLESFQPGIYLRFAPDRWESCFQIRTKLQKDSAAAKTTTEERSSKYAFIKLKLKLLKTPQLRRYFD